MTSPATPRMLGELLVEAGLLSPSQLEQALDEQRKLGRRLGRVLVALGWLTEQQLVEILGRQLLVAVAPEARLRQIVPPRGVLEMVSAEQAHTHRILPIFYSAQERALSVVMSDPLDSSVLTILRETHSLVKLRVLLAAEPLLEEMITRFYGGRPAHLPPPALLPPVALLRPPSSMPRVMGVPVTPAMPAPAAYSPAPAAYSPAPAAPDAVLPSPPHAPGAAVSMEAPSLQQFHSAMSPSSPHPGSTTAGVSPGPAQQPVGDPTSNTSSGMGSSAPSPASSGAPSSGGASSGGAEASVSSTLPPMPPGIPRPPEPASGSSSSSATPSPAPQALASSPLRAGSGKAVLLLEPEDRYAQVLGGYLTLEGFTVLRVRDAATLERAIDRAPSALVALRQNLDESQYGEALRRIPGERLRRLPSGRAMLEEGTASTLWLESLLRILDFFFSLVEDEKVLPKARQLRQISQWSRLLGHRLGLAPRASDALALGGYLYPLGELMLSRQGASQAVASESPARLAADLVAGFGLPVPVEPLLRALADAPNANGLGANSQGTNSQGTNSQGTSSHGIRPDEILRTLSAYLEIRDGSHRHTRSGHEKALRLVQEQSGTRYSARVVDAIRELTAKEHLLGQLEGDAPAGLSLLLVDKDRLTLEMLEMRSTKEGFRVRTARSGDEALKLMDAELPQILITEISLPKMDGFELLARVKADARSRELPCFLLSGRSDAQYITKGLELGAEDVLVKPLNLDILVSKIRRLERSLEATRQKSASGVQGSLAELGLFDLLQVLQLGQKSVKVELTRGGAVSQLWLDQGELTSASLNDPRSSHKTGRDAFFELCTWEHGSFAVSPAKDPPARNIHESNDFLLMEGMRRADEARATQPTP